jgi:hypothetical protein
VGAAAPPAGALTSASAYVAYATIPNTAGLIPITAAGTLGPVVDGDNAGFGPLAITPDGRTAYVTSANASNYRLLAR